MMIGTWGQRFVLQQERMIEAVVQIADEGKLLQLTISDVARRSRLTGPAVYQYFRDRTHLLLEAQRACCERLDDVARRATGGGRSVRDQHRSLWVATIGFVLSRPGLGELLSLPLPPRDELLVSPIEGLVWAVDAELSAEHVRKRAVPAALVFRGAVLESARNSDDTDPSCQTLLESSCWTAVERMLMNSATPSRR